ncbi:hypothetical protein B0H12DRAFT_1096488 [Mycena haematopus]|nr:hypothetical protein B0H12DRAFT_1096488 [Mycena haematopus]
MSAAIRVNPSFVAHQPHPAPGPSAGPVTAVSVPPTPQLPASLKRKQSQIVLQNTDDDTQDESSPSASQGPRPRTRDRPKKKKASRACVHCQKAHLTCDDARPCQRCVKRGIAANCTEGHRKKAKYLLDEEELGAKLKSRRGKSSSVPEPSVEPSPEQQPAAPPPPPQAPPPPPAQSPFDPAADQLFAPFDPSFPFGSEAANLEYSILSAILGNPSPPETSTSPDPSAPPGGGEYGAGFNEAQIVVQPSETTISTSPTTGFLGYAYPQTQQEEAMQYSAQFQQQQQGEPHPLQPRFPLDTRPRSPHFSSKDSALSSFAAAHAHPPHPHPHPHPDLQQHHQQHQQQTQSGSQLQNINDRVTMPYDYTEGYHFLMKHLPSRFEKNDILRIVRALAIFRPSLIALQMPLSFDDEVFVEKCFQRSLLELDKLISFSGTPTVVWRRTGEICLVAPEFCMLTEWSLDELVGRKKYIYELFENQSVVEYWENFASHAFENTTQSVYSHCVLLKPSGAPVPSTFCISIRRDLFDLPSVVIGQWLPLL